MSTCVVCDEDTEIAGPDVVVKTCQACRSHWHLDCTPSITLKKICAGHEEEAEMDDNGLKDELEAFIAQYFHYDEREFLVEYVESGFRTEECVLCKKISVDNKVRKFIADTKQVEREDDDDFCPLCCDKLHADSDPSSADAESLLNFVIKTKYGGDRKALEKEYRRSLK